MASGICEVCGERRAVGRHAIEGALLNVCERCGHFGPQVREVFVTKRTAVSLGSREGIGGEQPEDFVPKFGEVVRRARERKKLTQQEVAVKINEKESVIAKIEQGVLLPSKQTAARLEKLLSIRLSGGDETKEKGKQEAGGKPRPPPAAGMTLGDVVKLK